jgi:hypothetical protein
MSRPVLFSAAGTASAFSGAADCAASFGKLLYPFTGAVSEALGTAVFEGARSLMPARSASEIPAAGAGVAKVMLGVLNVGPPPFPITTTVLPAGTTWPLGPTVTYCAHAEKGAARIDANRILSNMVHSCTYLQIGLRGVGHCCQS